VIRAAVLAVVIVGAACAADPAPPDDTLAPPADGEGFQLDEGDFVADAGQEGLYCMRLPIPAEPYGDGALFVTGIESRLPVGTHHFFMAYRSEPAIDVAEPCFDSGAFVSVDEADQHDGGGGKMIFLSGEGAYAYQMPPGYAMYLATGAGQMVTSHHVLNSADEPRDMYGVFNVYTAPLASITHPVNTLNCLLRDIWVAPRSTATVSATCTAPFDLDMVVLSSHAHQHLERFEMRVFDGAQTVGDPIYVSTDWDSPEIVTLDTPLHLGVGQGLTFSCTFRNTGDEWIVFGTGDYGEMCAIMSGYAYPPDRPGEVPPSLGTIIYRDGHGAPLVETTDLDGPF
jgi:hypothetical protein